MARLDFSPDETNAVEAGYIEATRLSPITPKNKAEILKTYNLAPGAVKGKSDTELSRIAAQHVLDKFVADREAAKRAAAEAEARRVAAEQAAKAAAEAAERQRQQQIAAQAAAQQAEAVRQAQVAAQQAAIAARSASRVNNYTSPVPVRAATLPDTRMPLPAPKPYVAPKIIGSVPKYTPPPPPPTRIATNRTPVIR